jgi:Uma2 family endonuclease
LIEEESAMSALVVPRVYRFTKAEFHQMHDLGFFVDKYVELIDGEVIDMPGPGHAHCVSTDKSAEALKLVFGVNVWVRVQMPLDLYPRSEPLPDVAAIAGARDSHTATPTTALLVVEVSETTLVIDRGVKGSLYAAAGIADYWIVDLNARRLEVYRNPVADATQPFGFRYADVVVLSPADVAIPLAAPSAQVLVSQLLP